MKRAWRYFLDRSISPKTVRQVFEQADLSREKSGNVDDLNHIKVFVPAVYFTTTIEFLDFLNGVQQYLGISPQARGHPFGEASGRN